MKTLAICSSSVKNILPESYIQLFSFHGKKIITGLLSISNENISNIKNTDVAIKVKAFSCNYRDRTLFSMYSTRCNEIGNNEKVCYSPFGSDFVAEVIACGKNVTELKIGDRVIPNSNYPSNLGKAGHGGIPTNFASQRIHIFNEQQLIKIPSFMPDEIAAGFTITAQTVYSILRRLDLKSEENVLITAPSSNTSLTIINSLKNTGVNVFALASSLSYEKYLLDLGIIKVFLISDLNKENVYNYTNGRYFNSIIDPFFNIYFLKILPFISFNGKYITFGINQYTAKIGNHNLEKIIGHSISRNISIMGNCLGNTKDLKNALIDFSENKFSIPIDSIFENNSIIPFLEKSFGLRPRLGKTIYKYND